MIKDIVVIAVPSFIAMVSQICIEVINLHFIGHLGDSTLVAGVGLGNMYINIMGFAILNGLNSTVCTLVS